MGLHDTNPDPRVDGYGHDPSGVSSADWVDSRHEDLERDRKRNYPRGQGPAYSGEDGPEHDDPNGFSLDQHDPDRFLSDPGFSEAPAPHPDPDHGREDRLGSILTQGQQWPERYAALVIAQEGHYDDYDHALNDQEHQEAHESLGHHASMDQLFILD